MSHSWTEKLMDVNKQTVGCMDLTDMCMYV